MSFGKPGRPPEDRLARQREIYLAVAPLLLRDGARGLAMRDAAHAACLSVGGLYHYFPTKHDLVLHGLHLEARDRLCREYRARLARLAPWTLDAYLEAYLDHAERMFAFVQPAVQAALDLGVAAWQAQLDSGFTAHVEELTATLRRLAPGLPERDLQALGRAVRRVALGTLLDRHADFAEMREQLRALIRGYTAAARRDTTAVGT